VPVTPEQMAREARDAFNSGASIMHVHLRRQEPGMGHLPSWDPDLADAIVGAIRNACPGVIVNLTRGVIGPDISGPAAGVRRTRPEIAACNAGSLNYLKLKDDADGVRQSGAEGPPVHRRNVRVRCASGVRMLRRRYRALGRLVRTKRRLDCLHRSRRVQLRDGRCFRYAVCDADLLALLPRYLLEQTTLIGCREVWPVHQKTAELGGMLRTGLEDTFYLPDGGHAGGNGVLAQALATCAEPAGRSVAIRSRHAKSWGFTHDYARRTAHPSLPAGHRCAVSECSRLLRAGRASLGGNHLG
jgi:uncharacterized protein (DUF849 family)